LTLPHILVPVVIFTLKNTHSYGVQEYLHSDEGMQEVDERVKQAQAEGISSVPWFIVRDTYVLKGAHPPEAFQKAFDQTLNEA
jgi:predicted DsbA family dithiol-disulfide isomerase